MYVPLPRPSFSSTLPSSHISTERSLARVTATHVSHVVEDAEVGIFPESGARLLALGHGGVVAGGHRVVGVIVAVEELKIAMKLLQPFSPVLRHYGNG